MFLTTIFIQFLALSCAMAADDWVVHVAKGIDTASKVAKLHHLDNLGEVIPGMEIFIFLCLIFRLTVHSPNLFRISVFLKPFDKLVKCLEYSDNLSQIINSYFFVNMYISLNMFNF